MATRSEAKRLLWEASDQDDAAREFITGFMKNHSQDAPGGSVDDIVLAGAVKEIKPKPVAKKKVK